MKKMKQIFGLGIAMIAFSTVTNAQVDATADAKATIVAPIAISKVTNLDFGDIAVSTGGGSVTVPAAATGSRTPSGDVTLPTLNTAFTAAKFTVTGADGYGYTITLPADVTLTNTTGSGGETMVMGTFKTDKASNKSSLSSSTDDFYVGATLTVGGSQAAGVYTNTTDFKVSVNYN